MIDEHGNQTTLKQQLQDDIVAMIDRMARREGLDLASFYELGKNDQLTNPLLRELWLIWGDALTP